MKYCPSCGNEMDDNAVMCVKCGNAVAAPAPVAAKKQPSKLWPMLVIGGVLLVLGMAFEFFGVMGGLIIDDDIYYISQPIYTILEFVGNILLLICGFDILRNKPGILR